MTPEPLLVVGAGGFARETLELIDAINDVEPRWRVVGILDDDPGRRGALVHGVEVIGPAALARELADVRVCACVASPDRPAGRMALVRRLGLDPERYAHARAPGRGRRTVGVARAGLGAARRPRCSPPT